MASSTSAGELFDSGPDVRPTRSPSSRRRLGVVAVALIAAAAVIAAVFGGTFRRDSPPSVAFVDAWIDAWNARDAQTVSSMTCGDPPAFVPAGTIETYLSWTPAGRPIVADHAVTGTRRNLVAGRWGVGVDLTYVPGARSTTQETSVFVRTRSGGDMCIGYFSVW